MSGQRASWELGLGNWELPPSPGDKASGRDQNARRPGLDGRRDRVNLGHETVVALVSILKTNRRAHRGRPADSPTAAGSPLSMRKSKRIGSMPSRTYENPGNPGSSAHRRNRGDKLTSVVIERLRIRREHLLEASAIAVLEARQALL